MSTRKRRSRQSEEAAETLGRYPSPKASPKRNGTSKGRGVGALCGRGAARGVVPTTTSAKCQHENPRLARLVDHIVSSFVQLHAPTELQEVQAELSPAEVEKVLVDRVPGVRSFTYRDGGSASLGFIKAAYADGIPNYRNTPMHNHYLWLLRLVVHRGRGNNANDARHIRFVAEAFQDCQDVQARVIEREGLELCGLSLDFRGQVVKLAGDYKLVALQMLAAEKTGSSNTIHYENLVLQDMGDYLGLNQCDVQRANLDREVDSRFSHLSQREKVAFEAKLKQFFDIEAMMKTFCNEVNSFSQSSPAESLTSKFLLWVSAKLKEPHRIFDDTQTQLHIDEKLVLPCLEVLFIGEAQSQEDRDLFVS